MSSEKSWPSADIYKAHWRWEKAKTINFRRISVLSDRTRLKLVACMCIDGYCLETDTEHTPENRLVWSIRGRRILCCKNRLTTYDRIYCGGHWLTKFGPKTRADVEHLRSPLFDTINDRTVIVYEPSVARRNYRRIAYTTAHALNWYCP